MMPDYPWRDRTDPQEFASDFERGFRHYRAEYSRMSEMVTKSAGKVHRNELDAMRRARDEAAARALGFSLHVL